MRKLLIVVVIGAVTALLVAHMNQRELLPLEIVVQADLDFSAMALVSEQREWFDMMWGALDGETYPNAEQIAGTNDLYLLGRALQPHILALHTAFRATGDIHLLDEIDRLMEIARAQLADTNGDGYLNWLWTHDPNEPIYYQTDNHQMDEILAHNLVAFFAYVLRQNQDIKPVYREHADFWEDYLLNHFIAKWTKRGNGVFQIDKSLTHVYAHMMTFNYYLYRLTGNLSYLEEAELRADVLNNMMVLEENDAFTWDHRVPDLGHPPLGCQKTDYARYTLSAFQQMAFEGFSYYADDAYMAHYAATIRENVLQQGGAVVAEDVCGNVGDEHASGDYMLSMMSCFARWDDTGYIEAGSVQVLSYTDPTPINTVFIPACMVSVRSAS